MHIRFSNGTQLQMPKHPSAASAVVSGHKRDVLTVTVTGEFADVKAAFDGSPWAIVDGESTYDKSGYTLPVSVCDNLDGTVTVRIARANTREEDLEDEKAALIEEKNALSAQVDDLLIEVLEGGTADV